jgi:hypothetical protein
MKSEEFVAMVKMQTSDSAVEGTIKTVTSPPGRKPSEKLLRLSGWYNRLDGHDKAMLKEALRHAAESAIFGFFCILDGVRAIENTPDKGDLELYFCKDDQRIRLNDPHQEELHNLFNALR